MSDAVPGVVVAPYFAETELRSVRSGPLLHYFVAVVRSREAGAELVQLLLSMDEVENAYVEAGPTPPPANPANDPRNLSQGYLDAAPNGIDARWAWSRTEGAGVTFVDVEQGWTLNHDDLAAAGITLISGLNHAYEDHGTAVLGEVVATDNASYGIGIAPKTMCRVVSQWRTTTTYSTSAAILSAVQVMSPGDVLLIEAQFGAGGTVTNSSGDTFSRQYLPVEVEEVTFDAIRHAVDLGIVVVEAAGNGEWTSFDAAGNDIRTGVDLDSWSDPTHGTFLNRDSRDFRDSGAIMVAAATSVVPHRRSDFSNHGSRIDCFGWGENVYTLGYGAGSATRRETFGFSGTSSASPIVAGAAVLFQSWIKSRHSGVQYYSPYSPSDLRDLLSDAGLNTDSGNPAVDRIGVLPDLRRIIETVEAGLAQVRIPKGVFQNYLTARVLFGLIDDTPGVIWVPGKGPIPVDPGWGSIHAFVSGPKRNLVTAMAVHELAVTLRKSDAQAHLVSAALQAMREAVNEMQASG